MLQRYARRNAFCGTNGFQTVAYSGSDLTADHWSVYTWLPFGVASASCDHEKRSGCSLLPASQYLPPLSLSRTSHRRAAIAMSSLSVSADIPPNVQVTVNCLAPSLSLSDIWIFFAVISPHLPPSLNITARLLLPVIVTDSTSSSVAAHIPLHPGMVGHPADFLSKFSMFSNAVYRFGTNCTFFFLNTSSFVPYSVTQSENCSAYSFSVSL